MVLIARFRRSHIIINQDVEHLQGSPGL